MMATAAKAACNLTLMPKRHFVTCEARLLSETAPGLTSRLLFIPSVPHHAAMTPVRADRLSPNSSAARHARRRNSPQAPPNVCQLADTLPSFSTGLDLPSA